MYVSALKKSKSVPSVKTSILDSLSKVSELSANVQVEQFKMGMLALSDAVVIAPIIKSKYTICMNSKKWKYIIQKCLQIM